MMLFIITQLDMKLFYDGCEACTNGFPCPDCLKAILHKICQNLDCYWKFDVNGRKVSLSVDLDPIPESILSSSSRAHMTHDEIAEYLCLRTRYRRGKNDRS
jgi:hypothetical protein